MVLRVIGVLLAIVGGVWLLFGFVVQAMVAILIGIVLYAYGDEGRIL